MCVFLSLSLSLSFVCVCAFLLLDSFAKYIHQHSFKHNLCPYIQLLSKKQIKFDPGLDFLIVPFWKTRQTNRKTKTCN